MSARADDITRIGAEGDSDALREILEARDVVASAKLRHRLLTQLGRRRDAASAEALGALLTRDPDAVIRLEAARLLGQAARHNASSFLQRAALDDSNARVRLESIESTLKLEDLSEATLLEGLSDEHWAVREVACRGLGVLRSEAAVASLAERLRDSHRLVRHAAGRALAEIPHVGAAEALELAAVGAGPINRRVLLNQAEKARHRPGAADAG
jgi:HEAT repeat protein